MLFFLPAEDGWRWEFQGTGSDKLRKPVTLQRTEVTLAPALALSGCQRTKTGQLKQRRSSPHGPGGWRPEAQAPGAGSSCDLSPWRVGSLLLHVLGWSCPCAWHPCIYIYTHGASQVALVAENPLPSRRRNRHGGSIPGSGSSPGGGHGNPLQYACLESPMDRGAW